MSNEIKMTVKDLIKYALFLLVLGGTITSVTWSISVRPDRQEVKEMINDTLDPIHKQLSRIEKSIDNFSKQKETDR